MYIFLNDIHKKLRDDIWANYENVGMFCDMRQFGNGGKTQNRETKQDFHLLALFITDGDWIKTCSEIL